MMRTVLGAVAGIVVWIVLIEAMDLTLRHFWPDYAAVFKAMTFSLPMMIARLAESTIALIAAAITAMRVSRGAAAAPWILGIVMLLPFAYFHYTIWEKFPVWYHAYFLSSLLLVPVIVGRLVRRT